MAKAVGACPRPCICGQGRWGKDKAEGAGPWQCGRGQSRGVEATAEAKAVGAWPRLWGRDKGRGGGSKPWGRCRGRGAVAKPWGRDRDCGGVAKAVWVRPRLRRRGQRRAGVV